MDLTQKELDALAKIAEFEKTVPETNWRLGWDWSQVGVFPGVINNLLAKGVVEKTYSSHKYKNYKLTDKGKGISAFGLEGTEEEEAEEVSLTDLFSNIVGYDDLKELLKETLQLDKPIHILMHGPPSVAKTLFLWEIERVGGTRTMWLMGSGTSKSGMWDAVADRRPKWILVDELEKMNVVDMAGLLSLMEKGRVVRTKVRRGMDVTLNSWVIATANRIDKLPVELKSRFAIMRLEEYSASEFVQVVSKVLVVYEDVNEDDAHEIALRLVGLSHDVRDAIRVARLSKRVGVERAVELLVRR